MNPSPYQHSWSPNLGKFNTTFQVCQYWQNKLNLLEMEFCSPNKSDQPQSFQKWKPRGEYVATADFHQTHLYLAHLTWSKFKIWHCSNKNVHVLMDEGTRKIFKHTRGFYSCTWYTEHLKLLMLRHFSGREDRDGCKVVWVISDLTNPKSEELPLERLIGSGRPARAEAPTWVWDPAGLPTMWPADRVCGGFQLKL